MTDYGDDDGYRIDLERGTITHDCGYELNIIEMLDRSEQGTDVIEDAVFIVVQWPPEGLLTLHDLRDLGDHVYTDERLH